ncbi:MAG: transaldolase [Epsilonproteobacteria bacterium]|nr:transaldolase [Campylobacterota bacterium]NPA57495.1 transaldolase [Campylobacterota bacterium]
MYREDLHFSLWIDFIERSFLEGPFQELIDRKIINGATSNPAIFREAILTSPAYREQLSQLEGLPAKERYEALAVEDIRRAATLLLPLYERGDDGFVSIEVDPRLHDDLQGSVEEARRLVERIGMPNVMVKIPATEAGYRAIETLAAEGFPINVTLIFSPRQAERALDALERGYERGGSTGSQSVLSIFVSRFDRKLDPLLPQELKGRVGIMNGARIYNLIRGRALPNTRPLFASTSVKGGDYPPYYYVQELLAPDSINTAPLQTIQSFIESGSGEPRLPIGEEEIDKFFSLLNDNGIDMERIYDQLLEEGLRAFVDAFQEILKELS